MPRLLALVVAATLTLAACAGDDDAGVDVGTAPTAPTTGVDDGTADGDDMALTTCTNTELGYRVAYPAGWETNTEETLPACAAFHPEPFEVPKATEFFGAAAIVRVEPAPYDEVSNVEDDRAVDVLSSEATRVDGQNAQSAELRSTGEALLPEGVRHYRYAVDMGDDRTLVLVTYEVEGLDYERNKEIIDQMASSLTITA